MSMYINAVHRDLHLLTHAVPTRRASDLCIVPVPPPAPGFYLRARPLFGIETTSSSLSTLVPHEGERSSESLDCIFWHSILSTSSAGMRISTPNRKERNSPRSIILRIRPSLHSQRADRKSTRLNSSH